MNNQATATAAKSQRAAEQNVTQGFHRDRLHSFDPQTVVIKSTCDACTCWLTANSSEDLTKKEVLHAATCSKSAPLQ